MSLVSPITSSRNPETERVYDMKTTAKQVDLKDGCYTWFKSVLPVDLELYGGIEPFVMVLAVISSLQD